MVLQIQLGLLKIPVMLINTVNNRYTQTGMKMFSTCCQAPVGQKKYCKECGKDLRATEIKKGFDSETILTEEQQDKLKTFMENGIIDVLQIEDILPTTKEQLLVNSIKSQVVFPSISKGYRKTDIATFLSFSEALKEEEKYCLVKITQRATEHLGILIHHKDDLMFFEIPFTHYTNREEIRRLKQAVRFILMEEIKEPHKFKDQAKDFISRYKDKVEDIEEVEEEKKVLLNKFIESIRNGEEIEENEPIKEEINPFAV